MEQQRHFFREIPEREVHSKTVSSVRVVLERASLDLSIRRTIELHWIVRATALDGPIKRDFDIYGQMIPHAEKCVVLLRADRPLRGILRTVLHEIRHVKQVEDARISAHEYFALNSAFCEREASEYGERFPGLIDTLIYGL